MSPGGLGPLLEGPSISLGGGPVQPSRDLESADGFPHVFPRDVGFSTAASTVIPRWLGRASPSEMSLRAGGFRAKQSPQRGDCFAASLLAMTIVRGDCSPRSGCKPRPAAPPGCSARARRPALHRNAFPGTARPAAPASWRGGRRCGAMRCKCRRFAPRNDYRVERLLALGCAQGGCRRPRERFVPRNDRRDQSAAPCHPRPYRVA